ncbi:hypothetical protein [Nitrosopumilus piranensis]|uniref:Uncharacterized protein n=1 Tax=Nitrosopumilus piranensis TaxID=1582439 RepID=A0A0C5BXN5_9ARCH|nr:hypothetical protein [Nitrosopumilus piranensis]AJM93051.1 membrane protein of unknown function [Nitrosopumilus piranensis]
MKTKEKILLSVTTTITLLSFAIVPIMTEISYMIGKYPSAEHIPISDLLLINFYTHAVTYFDQFYLAGWYAGYSIHLPNLSMDLAHYLNSVTSTSFVFSFSSSVFSYLEAPPWDATYVILAMYLPLLAIIPSWICTRTIPIWRRVLYVYFVVTQISVIARLTLLFVL